MNKKINVLNLIKPNIYGSLDVWGHILNGDLDKIGKFSEEVILDSENKDQELARLEKMIIPKDEIDSVIGVKVDNYVETSVKPNLDNYVNQTSKPNLDNYIDQKKSDLDNYISGKEAELKGATYTPSVSESGDLSWTNDKNLPNPPSVNIKGEKGDAGNFIFKVENGHLILYTVDNNVAPNFTLEGGHLIMEIN